MTSFACVQLLDSESCRILLALHSGHYHQLLWPVSPVHGEESDVLERESRTSSVAGFMIMRQESGHPDQLLVHFQTITPW